ncbi:ABC transporter permease [Methanocella conradii]|uniref:ABC transporter permease n=1 Tax=Methanocella conradii TaxID=1175444 RepID=UPI0024B3A2C9|nr:ABC transporter permease [Methanocella conradii]MDI6898063.1 ABC transporter permease [Methanocella conradii]
MGNTLVIARKEFEDLFSNKLVIIIIVVYVAMILMKLYSYYRNILSYGFYPGDSVLSLLSVWVDVVVLYGSAVATVIGVASIANERSSHALNTLLVKPLYRDTIINGKLIGVMAFMSCVLGLVAALYVSSIFILLGSQVSSFIGAFLAWVPPFFVLSIIAASISLLLSMLISILVKEQYYALFLSVLSWIMLNLYVCSVCFAQNIAVLFGASRNAMEAFLGELSPVGSLNCIILYVSDTDNALRVLSAYSGVIIRLALLAVVLLVLNYVTFLRRDVQ